MGGVCRLEGARDETDWGPVGCSPCQHPRPFWSGCVPHGPLYHRSNKYEGVPRDTLLLCISLG